MVKAYESPKVKLDLKIGIDFDNTIVIYDEVFYEEALAHCLIDEATPRLKRAVREAVMREHGLETWIRLQSEVYTHGMKHATLAPGFKDFLSWAEEECVDLVIVSHKTKRANVTGEDLRGPAMRWLSQHGLESLNVYFEETLTEKLHRIQTEACTDFVDDLKEVLNHSDFPNKVRCWLYADVTWKELLNQIKQQALEVRTSQR